MPSPKPPLTTVAGITRFTLFTLCSVTLIRQWACHCRLQGFKLFLGVIAQVNADAGFAYLIARPFARTSSVHAIRTAVDNHSLNGVLRSRKGFDELVHVLERVVEVGRYSESIPLGAVMMFLALR